jgi:putative pyruvate formate lyase activating enzyme
MNLDLTAFENCRLCPRNCGVNRVGGQTGFCGETADLRIATIEPHFGEEPPFSGKNGSGTVFFSGCSLKCEFCQNHQISRDGIGQKFTVDEIVQRLTFLVQEKKIHNINFVTPDHFFPYCVQIVKNIRQNSIEQPILFNLSGYQKTTVLNSLEGYADIYLPDFKYSDSRLARELSNAENYPAVALDALVEMVKQKGFLDSFLHEEAPLATCGVLVRHLILPGFVKNSMDALTSLFLEFGTELPISLMSQYVPVKPNKIQSLNRQITSEEFETVYEHLQTLGFRHLFVQFPEAKGEPLFLPDFKERHPFKGNFPR